MKTFSTRSALAVVAGIAVASCGRVGVESLPGSGADAGAQGGGGNGGSPGAGGRSASDTDAAGTCVATAFSTAPVECSQDWSHAVLQYKTTCQPTSGGYQARCAPYDAIAYVGRTTDTWCFYAKTTGNLVGSFVRDAQGAGDCKSFDLDFAKPDVTACVPVSATCPADGGP